VLCTLFCVVVASLSNLLLALYGLQGDAPSASSGIVRSEEVSAATAVDLSQCVYLDNEGLVT